MSADSFINIDGTRETVAVPTSITPKNEGWWARTVRRFTEKPPDALRPEETPAASPPREEIIVEDDTRGDLIEAPTMPRNPAAPRWVSIFCYAQRRWFDISSSSWPYDR